MNNEISETNLKIKILKMIKRNFPSAWTWKTSDKFISGIPDLIVIIKGIHIFMEIKIPGENPTRIQILTMSQIEQAGGKCFVVRSVQEVKDIINNELNPGPTSLPSSR